MWKVSMKKLFLDSANLEEIKELIKTSAISGVTTNPSLIAKEAKEDYLEKLLKIKNVIVENKRRLHLSVEVITLDPIEMIDQTNQIYSKLIATNTDKQLVDLHIKIPAMFKSLPVITEIMSSKYIGRNVNATACMTVLQAKLASDAGAKIVSFFYNRMIDGFTSEQQQHDTNEKAKEKTVLEIKKAKEIIESEIICGSIRHASDVLECWSAGADIVTASYKIISEMISHKKTSEAIAQFQDDIDKWRAPKKVDKGK